MQAGRAHLLVVGPCVPDCIPSLAFAGGRQNAHVQPDVCAAAMHTRFSTSTGTGASAAATGQPLAPCCCFCCPGGNRVGGAGVVLAQLVPPLSQHFRKRFLPGRNGVGSSALSPSIVVAGRFKPGCNLLLLLLLLLLGQLLLHCPFRCHPAHPTSSCTLLLLLLLGGACPCQFLGRSEGRATKAAYPAVATLVQECVGCCTALCHSCAWHAVILPRQLACRTAACSRRQASRPRGLQQLLCQCLAVRSSSTGAVFCGAIQAVADQAHAGAA